MNAIQKGEESKDKRLEVWESFEAERLFEEAILMHF